jgi:hypothetical protein
MNVGHLAKDIMKFHSLVSIAVVVLLSPHVSTAQSVDDVVNGYVSFIGGVRNWKKVKTIKTNGTYDYGGIVFPFHTMSVSPDKYKFVVPLDGKYYAQGFDGVSGWRIDAFKNETVATPLVGKAARAMANEARVELEDPLINYAKKGHRVSLNGQTDCRGVRCFELLVKMNNGDEERWYIDARDFSLVMTRAVSRNSEMGGSLMEIYYSDYRKVDRVQIPFLAVCEISGQTILTIRVEAITLNETIPEGEFGAKTGVH